jgi:5-(carboxyamino)imidazole ribonucleotide synthase
VLEEFVDFEREVSVVAARGAGRGVRALRRGGQRAPQPHSGRDGGARLRAASALAREAVEITRAILEALDVVGVLCVEFFVTRDGRLLVNELAPRPHNSGHFTFDACLTSQFEQQLRAVCGLPLGSTELLRPAAMANLLGDLWSAASRTGRRPARFPT